MIATLRKYGITPLNSFHRINEVVHHLRGCPTYPGHVRAYSAERPDAPTSCYDMRDVMTAPGLFSYIVDKTWIAADYLRVALPRLYSINAFWTFLGGEDAPDIMKWHRDADDERFVALFIYGTDVLKDEDGAHYFTCKDGNQRVVLGQAGTAFMEDPSQLHMGKHPTTQPRLLIWARWGVSEVPPSYKWDKLRPMSRNDLPSYPSDQRLQKSVELVVQ